MLLTLILGFIAGAATIIFALQNTEIVGLTFMGWQFESSLALVIILAAGIGGLLGVLSSLPAILQRSLWIRRLRSENKGLQDEADTIRTMYENARTNAVAAANSGQPIAPVSESLY